MKLPKVTVILDDVDLACAEMLLERLIQQAGNVEADGHLNAARYMRTAARLCEQILNGRQP